MKVCALCTRDYDVDLAKLIGRRLKRLGFESIMEDCSDCCARIRIDNPDALNAFCSAAAGVLEQDLKQFELARMVNSLPMPLLDRQEILADSIHYAFRLERKEDLADKLKAYFDSNELLVAEGYLRFRMQDTMLIWEGCVMAAAQEYMLRKEYNRLMGTLAAFARLQRPRIREVSLILNPDGSCTITDDSDARIDCESCNCEGLITMLINIAPEHIRIYDLSCGRSEALASILVQVFEGRVQLLH